MVKKDIAALGEVLIDMTQSGEDSLGNRIFTAYPGGAPANVAVAAARLGAKSGFIGKVGRDAFGRSLAETLKKEGVDILDVFFCPHRRDAGCACCKPRPGMIHAALRKYPDIDMTQSFFAGDSAADEGIAAACTLPFYGVKRDCENRIESLSDLISFI